MEIANQWEHGDKLTRSLFSQGSVVCQPLNPHWDKLKVAVGPLASGDPQVTLSHMECLPQALALDMAEPFDALHVSLLLELVFAIPVGRAQHPSQKYFSGAPHNHHVGFTPETQSTKLSRWWQSPRILLTSNPCGMTKKRCNRHNLVAKGRCCNQIAFVANG